MRPRRSWPGDLRCGTRVTATLPAASWLLHPRNARRQGGLRSKLEAGNDSCRQQEAGGPRDRSPRKSLGWCGSGTAPRSRGVPRATGMRSGVLQGEACLRVGMRMRQRKLTAPNSGVAKPSQWLRPSPAVIRLENQLPPFGPAYFTLYEANTAHLQEVRRRVDIAFTQTIPAATERDRWQGAAKNACFKGIQMGAKIDHALQ